MVNLKYFITQPKAELKRRREGGGRSARQGGRKGNLGGLHHSCVMSEVGLEASTFLQKQKTREIAIGKQAGGVGT